MGSASDGSPLQNRDTVTLKDMIDAYNGNCMMRHVDVVHNRLNHVLHGDSLREGDFRVDDRVNLDDLELEYTNLKYSLTFYQSTQELERREIEHLRVK